MGILDLWPWFQHSVILTTVATNIQKCSPVSTHSESLELISQFYKSVSKAQIRGKPTLQINRFVESNNCFSLGDSH